MSGAIQARARRRDGWISLALLPLALLWLAPLYLMGVYASQSDAAIFSASTPLLPGGELFANVARVTQMVGFDRALLNSVVVAVVYAALSTLLTAMAGYAFARYDFVGKRPLFGLLVATLTVPYAVVIIPQYVLVARDLGLANTYAAVIVPPLFNALGVLFMRQTFVSLPQEILDAARMDGAGEFRIFFLVALPLVRPSLAALVIILFLASWNNYLWPLLVATEAQARTAPVALGGILSASSGIPPWGAIMAGASVLTLPMIAVFLFLQRHFVSGITAGAVK
ncbi:carbohydrate ABC transporter permease [Aureimonas jatrophae]|jgi:lactose/L-arabinose transport system permease protein|uniref:Carbohydrate ABC transporter membrane protein 2, CUT1 family n=1 Tax=Aureimonas jatrophae TaxID=1166073 RepID=A0A1H0F211_9HYPH|nr:carbohydrate ABC transporter permease [Aureimonas jatrophae]MBB3950217.1 lactose/L-arabinose transport system permease protein [Aureimonas jatrophae]SDN88586.1 carbohydrate ABC transporter membrane protein 2, CUT1 family [Aureimonas jatrophae]